MTKKVEPLEIKEAIELTKFMKAQGVQSFQLGDLRVSFREPEKRVLIKDPAEPGPDYSSATTPKCQHFNTSELIQCRDCGQRLLWDPRNPAV